ncbi:MAG: cupin domain-containing protein [Maricaulis sp.]|nr:cupin domain-containing protein [Maricaulis sp.]
MSAPNPIVNIDDISLEQGGHGEKFEYRIGRVGPVIGADQLGCSLTVVRPGKRAFPHHNHLVNEEMMVILSGAGEYRFGEAVYPVKEGDVIAAPAGGRDKAHQLINTGADDLKYLCMSTMLKTDVVEYPDSNKIGISSYANSDDDEPVFRHLAVMGERAGYWDGEG